MVVNMFVSCFQLLRTVVPKCRGVIVLLVSTLFFFIITSEFCAAQNILPTPMYINSSSAKFTVKKELTVGFDKGGIETARYLSGMLSNYVSIKSVKSDSCDIVLTTVKAPEKLGDEGYTLDVKKSCICITANNETGLFYGVQSLLQLLPPEVLAQKSFDLAGYVVDGLTVTDKPKYGWRSFMLDSGRQYQSPRFIKRYLQHMAMLKMNVFHWHLTDGQGWRIQIKRYPKLTKIGSNVAKGKEQQGFYTQDEIRDIVAYAKKLHITVVPEIDVPGHSEAALSAYPDMTCFNKAPKTVMGFSANLFCAGSEKTYQFLENILDEVCELFPSNYIHLGGDEAPKANWDKCPKCQKKILDEGLANSHELQLYFSMRLAKCLKTKGRKTIFWGDVVYHEGMELPDNVVICWWNWRGHKDIALKNAIKRGHQVICNTNYYSYLNFPVTPWSKYSKSRTFDMKTIYEQNPSDLTNPNELVIGMGCCLWTDWYVHENMIDRRVFPRVFALSEQMWSSGDRLPFDEFYKKVKAKYPLLKKLDIDYGPTLIEEVPEGYKWD